MMGGKLLLVEDMYSELIFALVNGTLGKLRSKGFHIDVATSFERALDKARKTIYDLVITDYDLHGIIPGALYYVIPYSRTGIALAKEIRNMHPSMDIYIHLHSRRINAGRLPNECRSWEEAVNGGIINSFSGKWKLDGLLYMLENQELVPAQTPYSQQTDPISPSSPP